MDKSRQSKSVTASTVNWGDCQSIKHVRPASADNSSEQFTDLIKDLGSPTVGPEPGVEVEVEVEVIDITARLLATIVGRDPDLVATALPTVVP